MYIAWTRDAKEALTWAKGRQAQRIKRLCRELTRAEVVEFKVKKKSHNYHP